ncbi:hypothetical protein V6N11_075533 [Hibiscus sabdariffa]|uniref:Uncharacterized protein n=1 Tax=Hibiscus sabdariffa TaxID=183260 RepID=A0ABR2R7B3_9ROSI
MINGRSHRDMGEYRGFTALSLIAQLTFLRTLRGYSRLRGPMDKALVYGTRDSGFDPQRSRGPLSHHFRILFTCYIRLLMVVTIRPKLRDRRYEPCLVDFGQARLVEDDSGASFSTKPELVGSFGYMISDKHYG